MAYLNRALTNFRETVTARWPGRDKTSDGWIGDERHQKTDSDHNPDPDGSVDAWDMDVDGVDVWACIRAFEAHESSSYWIYNDQIAHRSTGWKRQSYAYAGPRRNKHDKHVHFNTRTSHERSNAPWNLGWDDDMAFFDAKQVDGRTGAQLVKDLWWATFRGNTLSVEQQALRRIELGQAAVLDAVKGVDTKAILGRIDQHAQAEAARDAELRTLIERAAAGELAADEVVRRIGELLTAPAGTTGQG